MNLIAQPEAPFQPAPGSADDSVVLGQREISPRGNPDWVTVVELVRRALHGSVVLAALKEEVRHLGVATARHVLLRCTTMQKIGVPDNRLPFPDHPVFWLELMFGDHFLYALFIERILFVARFESQILHAVVR